MSGASSIRFESLAPIELALSSSCVVVSRGIGQFSVVDTDRQVARQAPEPGERNRVLLPPIEKQRVGVEKGSLRVENVEQPELSGAVPRFGGDIGLIRGRNDVVGHDPGFVGGRTEMIEDRGEFCFPGDTGRVGVPPGPFGLEIRCLA